MNNYEYYLVGCCQYISSSSDFSLLDAGVCRGADFAMQVAKMTKLEGENFHLTVRKVERYFRY